MRSSQTGFFGFCAGGFWEGGWDRGWEVTSCEDDRGGPTWLAPVGVLARAVFVG
jgi:hypothetical protein